MARLTAPSAPTPLTPLGLSALALLSERPMHPYEMYQLLMQRGEDRIVKVRPGSLYHTVDRLARAGLVHATGTDREGNRPERTTYAVTDLGRESLVERITEMLGNPINEYPEFPLAVGQAHNLPKAKVIELLQCRTIGLRSTVKELESGRDGASDRKVERKYWIDATYLIAMHTAEVAWIERTIADLESGELAW